MTSLEQRELRGLIIDLLERGDVSDVTPPLSRMSRDFHDKYSLTRMLGRKKIPQIRVKMYPHQCNALFAMMLLEDSTRKGDPIKLTDDEREQAKRSLFQFQDNDRNNTVRVAKIKDTNIGLLTDPPAAGKSLCVIAAAVGLRPRQSPKELQQRAYNSVKNRTVMGGNVVCDVYPELRMKDVRVIPTTIVVAPRTVVLQWQKYIREMTSCDNFLIGLSYLTKRQTQRLFMRRKLTRKIKEGEEGEQEEGEEEEEEEDEEDDDDDELRPYDIAVLDERAMSNLALHFKDNTRVFMRIAIDEADSIKLETKVKLPFTLFTWYITATPKDLLMGTSRTTDLRHIYFMPGRTRGIEAINNNSFKAAMQLIVASDPELVAESMGLPVPEETTVNAIPRRVLHSLYEANVIPSNVMNQVNAGDIRGAIRELGCDTTSSEEFFIGALVGHHRQAMEEKIRLRDSGDYTSPAALQALDTEIDHIRKKINDIEQRVKESNCCPISMEEIKTKTVVRCCSNAFEFESLVKALKAKAACPMCRAPIHDIETSFTVIRNDEEESMTCPSLSEKKKKDKNKVARRQEEKDKPDVVVDEITRAPPGSRILIFSMHDMSEYRSKVESLRDSHSREAGRIACDTPKGHNTTIRNILKRFNDTSDRVTKHILFLDGMQFGAGLNLEVTTHIITMHEMKRDRYKQLIGRAQRPGRTTQLKVTNVRYQGQEDVFVRETRRGVLSNAELDAASA